MSALPDCGRRLVSSVCVLVLTLAAPITLWPQAGNGSFSGRVSNAATNANLEGAVVRLEGTNYSATTEREGSALAITLQRQLPNIRNVVSADAFGALVGNPADLLQRLPGLAGESVDGDIRYVQIRGMSRYLNTFSASQARLLYRLARPTLDLKTVYTINRRFDLYLDVINVFARADRAWECWGGRPNGTEWMRPEFLFGLNARL
jgi:hypothetical protein